MKKVIASLLTLAALSACAPEKSKTLVLFYSQTGATEEVANLFAEKLGSDIVPLQVTNPYDGTYDETIQRCLEEQKTGTTSELVPLNVDLSQYDEIFLGYPIWFGTFAPPIEILLKSVDLSGKTIVPFCTFGSGGLSTSSADLAKLLPDSTLKEGYGVRNARVASAASEIEEFLKAGGYIEGDAEVLAEFSAQQDVTDDQKAIFDAACSSYQMPLGTPVTCGSRTRNLGTEYLFVAQSQGRDGQMSSSKIYIICPSDGSDPEFTQVVR